MNQSKDVQPLRDKQQIEDMKWSLKKWCGERDYIFFLLGINTGLRAGDLLKLKVKQVKKKKAVKINETKTTKGRLVKLTSVYDELNAYIKTLPEGCEWLFPSRKGDKPITVTQAYRQLNKAAKMVDIEEGIGTHTMRKTFGYFFYKETKDIDSLQKILNHSSVAVTKKYIGITQEEIDKLLENFKL